MEHSCLKTLAAKKKYRKNEIIAHYQDGQGHWGISYETKGGMKRCYFANYADCRKVKNVSTSVTILESCDILKIHRIFYQPKSPPIYALRTLQTPIAT